MLNHQVAKNENIKLLLLLIHPEVGWWWGIGSMTSYTEGLGIKSREMVLGIMYMY